jgi:cellulose synthase/poly-beta-1,6-N-acetylglucosamine synthase-like glycosyltransferase
MAWANGLNYLYIALVVMISVYGLNALVITTLYLLRRRAQQPQPQEPETWPRVAVQIPLYNEQSIAGRMIDTICAFDYPKDRLSIQILDDSTDATTEIARLRVEHYRSLGFQIDIFHRTDRLGYKAGALHEALQRTSAEFVAIFDADFVPGPGYLKKIIPYFYHDPKIGMVQARWGHHNRNTNLITRVQALFLDGHQIVEQVARSRSKLLLNFNGTGGMWRTECIRDCGGWEWDTLAEDMDISYRAQMRGWRLLFIPHIVVPGEVPVSLNVFKKQQYRWAFGHIQVFRKLIVPIWKTPGLSIWQRIGGTFHLSSNFMQVAALIMFVLSVPMALLHPRQPSSLGLISLASTGPTILFAVSQIFGYRDGVRRTLDRLVHLPILVLVAIGLTVSNSTAVLAVFAGKKMVWSVTPKAASNGARAGSNGQVPLMVWMEIALSIYCAIGLSLAMRGAPELIPLSVLGMLSYGYVGCSGLVESSRPQKPSPVHVKMASE